MSKTMLRRICDSRGFTLVEVMITLAIAGIVTGALYAAYNIQQKTYYTQGQVVDMQQNIRAGMEIMTAEIRTATYDPGGEAAAGGTLIPLATRSQFRIQQDLNNDGDVLDANEDITYGLGGIDGDNDGAVDNVDTNNDSAVDGNAELTRTPFGGGAQAVAEGIQALEFYYLLDDGLTRTTTPSAAQLDNISAVQVTLLAVSSLKDKYYNEVESYTTPSGVVWGPYSDGFRRRLLTSTVKIRNHGLN